DGGYTFSRSALGEERATSREDSLLADLTDCSLPLKRARCPETLRPLVMREEPRVAGLSERTGTAVCSCCLSADGSGQRLAPALFNEAPPAARGGPGWPCGLKAAPQATGRDAAGTQPTPRSATSDHIQRSDWPLSVDRTNGDIG
ncbi:hypothetical protein AAFF_G00101040, partial [Aldrovandia affinis]